MENINWKVEELNSIAEIEKSLTTLQTLEDTKKGETVYALRSEMQNIMQNYFGVYRNEKLIKNDI